MHDHLSKPGPVPLRDSVLAMLVMLVWGVNFVVIDAGLADVPPLLLLSLRFVLVVFPLIFFVGRPRAPWHTVVAVGALMSLAQFSFLYLALDLGLPAGLASLLLQAQVIFTIVIAAAALGERPSTRQGVGALIGTFGLATVALAHGFSAPVLPVLVVLCAALSWALGNVVSRAAGVASGLSLVVWSALVVPLPALAMSLVFDGPDEVGRALRELSGIAIASTVYTAVGASLIGYAVWNTLLARHRAGAVVPFVLLVPPIGIVAAWLVQGEVPTVSELAGGVVMLTGVAIATITPSLRVRNRQLDPRLRDHGCEHSSTGRDEGVGPRRDDP